MSENKIIYRPTGRIVVRRIGESRLLVPVSGGVGGENAIFPLNETGLFAWERLSEGRPVGEVAAAIAENFEVDIESALADCQQMIRDLLKQKLLEVV